MRTSAGAGTRWWTSTTTWDSGSSRGGVCATSRSGGGTGWRCWAGSRGRSSARRGTAGWAGTGRCSSGVLHLIGNNTRFLVLPEASGIANLASRALSRSLRRLSADWEAAHGHPLELAETFVDPSRFRGTCYAASNWTRVGRTRGFARHNGSYTDPHGSPKEMFVRPLRADARARLAYPADRAEWTCRAVPVRYAPSELRSLRDVFAGLPDCRRGQGRKHALPAVLSVCALARLAGLSGPVAAAQYAAGLDARELRALGAWRSAAGEWKAPSAATICRVMVGTDPDALEGALREWAAPRPAEDADAVRRHAANRRKAAVRCAGPP